MAGVPSLIWQVASALGTLPDYPSLADLKALQATHHGVGKSTIDKLQQLWDTGRLQRAEVGALRSGGCAVAVVGGARGGGCWHAAAKMLGNAYGSREEASRAEAVASRSRNTELDLRTF